MVFENLLALIIAVEKECPQEIAFKWLDGEDIIDKQTGECITQIDIAPDGLVNKMMESYKKESPLPRANKIKF